MKLQRNTPLAGLTSLHAGGPAQALVRLEAGDNLTEIVGGSEQPIWPLGYGTNVLISDKGLPGTVILNRAGKIQVNGDMIEADSGANWDELVQTAIGENLRGLEFTSGVPGGVGAAVAGSIAAYGHRIADRFTNAQVLDTRNGSIETWDSARFNFGYRQSDIQLPENSHLTILSASFTLSDRPTGELEYDSALKVAAELGLKPDSLANRREIIMEARRQSGSLLEDSTDGHWTAGSFFKNPLVDEARIQDLLSHEEFQVSSNQLRHQNVIHGGSQARVSAAHVLLAAGFKRGQAWGNVRLHPDHILKIENTGGATASEIYGVVQHIIETVRQKLNITLEPEVRFLGEF